MISRNITLPTLSFRFKCNSSPAWIENLSISIDIKLPHSILRCMTLKVLKLKRITLKDLSHQVDFPNLKILHLKIVLFQLLWFVMCRVYVWTWYDFITLLINCGFILDLATVLFSNLKATLKQS
ncbi:transmembrane protein, putative [Medicago truncatula]|uniref:Transmembrane protein, putative n=1 Tax=Medicago truncatula TaxID=3880 RepID=G7IX88_MEDTR|nr:transmembrane protein, putative [Medicago truncatula]